MPLYFAYGANLDAAAMARRCPRAAALGIARLMHHRFFIMRQGVASVRRQPGSVVHGLLWRLAPSDVAPLDDFEGVAEGLYAKTIQPVLKAVGSARAFLYVGHTLEEGLPRPGYLDAVVVSARAIGLPEPYVRSLAALGRSGTQGRAFDNSPRDEAPGPVPGVRPRFATPLDRA